MARLPSSIVAGEVHGRRLRPEGVDRGDFGLSHAAKVVSQAAQDIDAADQREAKQAVVEARAAFDPSFATAAETYDGTAPGFAKGQVDAYDAAMAAARARLGGNAARHFDQIKLEDRLGVLDRAAGVEARASAAIVQRQRDADRTARVTKAATETLVETQGAVTEAFSSGDPTAPDFASKLLAGFDERTKARLEAAPEEDRPFLTTQFANQRGDLAVTIAAQSRALTDARLVTNTKGALAALENSVAADPAALGKALEQAPTLLAGLPAKLQAEMAPQVASDLTAASLRGMAERDDWAGVAERLKDPKVKAALRPELYAQFQGRATQALTGQQRQLAQQTVQHRLESELASIAETGQGTGLDVSAAALQAFGPVDGPVKAAEWRRAVADAKTVHDITHDFAALSPADQQARLDLIKPEAGDPDFARKKAVYDQAVTVATKQAQLRLTDPAQALLADKAAASLWLQAQDGDPAHARAWAADALARQAALGVPEDQRRILPSAEAKRVVQTVAGKDAAGKADALASVYGYAARFGDGAGRVLYELQRAGLPTDEAAVLNAVDGDPVIVGTFARAQARVPTVKLEKGEKERIEGAVQRALKPLADSYAGSPEGLAYADALTKAVTTMATAGVGDGKGVDDAARDAAKWFLNRFHIDPKGGWRLPPAVAAQRDVPVAGMALYARAPVRGKADGATAIRMGARGVLGDLTADGGAGLRPRGPEPYLTDAQKRARIADLAAKSGRWVTTGDDAGLMLTVPDPRTGLTPVLDKAGKPIVRTWAELMARAGRP